MGSTGIRNSGSLGFLTAVLPLHKWHDRHPVLRQARRGPSFCLSKIAERPLKGPLGVVSRGLTRWSPIAGVPLLEMAETGSSIVGDSLRSTAPRYRRGLAHRALALAAVYHFLISQIPVSSLEMTEAGPRCDALGLEVVRGGRSDTGWIRPAPASLVEWDGHFDMIISACRELHVVIRMCWHLDRRHCDTSALSPRP